MQTPAPVGVCLPTSLKAIGQAIQEEKKDERHVEDSGLRAAASAKNGMHLLNDLKAKRAGG
jgi:hypothetical protein